MRIDSRAGVQFGGIEDQAGEGLSIILSQTGDAQARYRFLVKAKTSQGTYDIGEFYTSPPNLNNNNPPGRLSRAVAMAVCPGAVSWSIQVSAVPGSDGALPDETADVILASSKCYTAPVGVERVGERYTYRSGLATGVTQNVTVLAGRKVLSLGGIGLAGGGTIVIGSGNTVAVPDGIGVNMEPGSTIPPNAVIAFTNVAWALELLESA